MVCDVCAREDHSAHQTPIHHCRKRVRRDTRGAGAVEVPPRHFGFAHAPCPVSMRRVSSRPDTAAGTAPIPGSLRDTRVTARRHDADAPASSVHRRQQRRGGPDRTAGGATAPRPRDGSSPRSPPWHSATAANGPSCSMARRHPASRRRSRVSPWFIPGMTAAMARMTESWSWWMHSRIGRRRWSTRPTQSCAPASARWARRSRGPAHC